MRKIFLMIVSFVVLGSALVGCAEKIDTDVKSVNEGKETDTSPVTPRNREGGGGK